MANVSNLTDLNSTMTTILNMQRKRQPPSFSKSQTIIQVTLFATLAAIVVLGNLVSIVTFLKTQSLRRRCHYLIISLSFADFLVGVTAFMGVYYFITFPNLNRNFNFALQTLDTFSSNASIMFLTAIALERFYAIYFPFRHRMLSFKFYMIFIAMLWLAAFSIAAFNVTGLFVPVFNKVHDYSAFAVTSFSLVLIIVPYTCISLKTRNSNLAASQDQNRRNLRDRKLAVTLLIVTLLSLLTWLPYQILFFAQLILEVTVTPYFMFLFIVSLLKFCNSGINVFIYIARMPEFRKAFLQNLRNIWKRESEGSSLYSARSVSSNLTSSRVERSKDASSSSIIAMENIQADMIQRNGSNIGKEHENSEEKATQRNKHENTLVTEKIESIDTKQHTKEVDSNDMENEVGIQNFGFFDTKF